ncbi:phosphoglycolate phosphatase, bacterial [Pseudohongiella acticola]|uniref:Phosphoglycolate phosphatase, bacterial n=1 Tax=Pseudohongiella acticola TaxID=1524254 RepID=A0A1E8CIC4_9GAMM|nr:HAD-IA family hydrolase [Pseudohongiella acticola]OFE12007.1 phosphoglycolate phosphatase, bacterial [Pseudohongiella acticola]
MTTMTGNQTAAVLFDLDGTLIDTAPDFSAVLHQLCADQGVTPPSDNAILATVSSGARALVELAFGLRPDAQGFDALFQTLLNQYMDQLQNTRSVLFADMDVLLGQLEASGIAWGVVTNKPERFSIPLMQRLDLAHRCSILICPDHVSQTKPHPEPLLLACDRLGCDPAHSIYVGDHPRDIEAGNAAGMRTIAAAYGYLPPFPAISEWGADHISPSVADIALYLSNHLIFSAQKGLTHEN